MKGVAALAAVALAFLAGACNKGPAQAALKEVDQALAAAGPELEMYVPGELESITAAVREARSQLDRGHYTEALKVAQELPARIQAAVGVATATKEKLTATWTEMSGTVPGLVRSLDEKMTTLEAGETLPRGMTAERLAAVRADLGSLNEAWAGATVAFQGGDLPRAVKAAQDVRAEAEALARMLGPTATAARPVIIDAPGPGPGGPP